MTQNSAQNPEGPAVCQPGGQQPSAEGDHAASAPQADTATSQPSGPAAAPTAQTAATPEGAKSGPSRPVTIAAKGFWGVFGNIGKTGNTASSTTGATQSAPATPPPAPGFADSLFDAASVVGPLALLLIMTQKKRTGFQLCACTQAAALGEYKKSALPLRSMGCASSLLLLAQVRNWGSNSRKSSSSLSVTGGCFSYTLTLVGAGCSAFFLAAGACAASATPGAKAISGRARISAAKTPECDKKFFIQYRTALIFESLSILW